MTQEYVRIVIDLLRFGYGAKLVGPLSMPLNGSCSDVVGAGSYPDSSSGASRTRHPTGVLWLSLVLEGAQPRRRSEDYRVRYTRYRPRRYKQPFCSAGHRQCDFVLLSTSVIGTFAYEEEPREIPNTLPRKWWPAPTQTSKARHQRASSRAKLESFQHDLFGDLETAILNQPSKYVGHHNARAVSH